MSASTPQNPTTATPAQGPQGASGAQGAQSTTGEQVVYVKLPPPGSTQAARRPQNAPNRLIGTVLNIFAFLLCCTLPISGGIIMVLLAVHSVQVGFPLLWLWIPMFIFVEAMALLVAYGIWREYSGWRVRRDYLR